MHGKRDNSSMIISKAILLGFGHHGKRRLFQSLLNLNQITDILIFDINPEVFSGIETDINGKKITTTNKFDDVLEIASEETFVVVGTTAKDHLSIVKSLASQNVKYLYIEKPLTQSMSDCDEMVNVIKANNIKTAVGFYNDYLSLTSNLDRLVKDYGLGELLKISSQGGAVCLATVGVHIIDLANLLFKSKVKEIIGKINSKIKSPRGDEYFIHDGLAYIVFENKKELLLSYNNRTMNSMTIMLTFEYGYIEADYDSEFIRVMGFETDCSDRPKYRCERPIELKKINNNFIVKFNEFFDTIFYNLLHGGVYCDIKRAQCNMRALLGLFISDKLDRRLEMPIHEDNQYYHERFPIT